jgi:hypothetical protein
VLNHSQPGIKKNSVQSQTSGFRAVSITR